MRFSFSLVMFISLLLSGHLFAKRGGCPKKMEDAVSEMAEWNKYGIVNDGTRVQFPKKCTPFMKSKKFMPLPKRHAGGTNRERYMDKDCKVYEWDSQHGRFEVYEPNSNNSALFHAGEATAVQGKLYADKLDSGRNNSDMDTGIPGIKMKKLCRDHSKGKARKYLSNSKAKNFLSCI